MKCPHCQYVDRFLDETGKFVNGEKGGFYEVGVGSYAKRLSEIYPYVEKRSIHACPSCEKLFIR